MDKNSRLAMLRNAATRNLKLSDESAILLDELRKEDSDLGGVAAWGETLAPDSVRVDAPVITDDESEYNTRLISPGMRVACDS